MRVLSTKQLDEYLVANANKNGLELTCIDVIETTPLDFDLSDMSVDQFDTIVFTSANAVKGFFKNDRSKDIITSLKVCATNGKTKNLLEQYGIYISMTASGSAELADMIIADRRAKSVLHVCGDLHMDILGARLKEADITYRPLAIYHTELLYPAVSKEYDAILFFSPSGVDSYRKNNKLDPKVLYGCIGGTTAAHLSSRIAEAEIIEAATPDPEEMINAIIQHRNNKE